MCKLALNTTLNKILKLNLLMCADSDTDTKNLRKRGEKYIFKKKLLVLHIRCRMSPVTCHQTTLLCCSSCYQAWVARGLVGLMDHSRPP